MPHRELYEALVALSTRRRWSRTPPDLRTIHLAVVRDAGDGAFDRLYRIVFLRMASSAALSLTAIWLVSRLRQRPGLSSVGWQWLLFASLLLACGWLIGTWLSEGARRRFREHDDSHPGPSAAR